MSAQHCKNHDVKRETDYNYDVIFLREVASLYKNSGENKNNLNDTLFDW